MRLSINGSPNLFAVAARCKSEVSMAAEQVTQKIRRKVSAANQNRQEFQAAITALQSSSKQLGQSIIKLQKSLVEVQPTIVHLNRQVNHWQRANEEPLAKIKHRLKQANNQHY